MKVFLIIWGGCCFLVVVFLFLVYATDQLPGVSIDQSRSEDLNKSGQVKLQVKDSRNGAEEECSPCEDNLKQLKEALERAEREHEGNVNAENVVPPKKAFEQLQKALELFNQERTPENVAHMKKMFEQFNKVLDLHDPKENAKTAAITTSNTQ